MLAVFLFFLQVVNVRLPEDRGRLRGFGYVEFTDRQNLLDALNMNEEVGINLNYLMVSIAVYNTVDAFDLSSTYLFAFSYGLICL